MRIKTLTFTLLALAFVTAAVGTALAQGPPADGRGAEKHAAAQERRAELSAARDAALTSFHENRTAALEDYRAANNATRAAFHEAKAQLRDDCQAQRNETKGNNSAFSKCMRDGLKPLIEQARAEHKASREAFLERMLESRTHAIAGFAQAKARAAERHGAPQEG